MSIDLHTHVIPDALLNRAASSSGLFGAHLDGKQLTHYGGFEVEITPDFNDVNAILSRMDQARLTKSWVSLSPTLFNYHLSDQVAEAFAAMANDALAEMVQSTSRLGAFAHLPMQAPEAAAVELERAVVQLGFQGALIGTNVGTRSLDDDEFRPVLAMAEQLGVALFLHPYFDGPKPRLEPYFFTNTIGNPLETALAASRLIMSATLDRFPTLKIVLAHGAGYLPYQLGRLDHAFKVRPEARVSISRPPSDYIHRFWVDTITHSDQALAFATEIFTTDRIVIGTDLPFDMAETDPVTRAELSGLSAQVLEANATTLLQPGAVQS